MRRPEFLTFTGIDRNTDLSMVQWLSRHYPVEWAIMVNGKRQGIDPRFPENDVQERFLSCPMIRHAVHFCGDRALEIVSSGGDHAEVAGPLGGLTRIQVNLPGYPDASPAAAALSARFRVRCVVQNRGRTFPDNTSVDWIYDRSGVGGVPLTGWIPHPGDGRLVGFGGGIRPETIGTVIADLDCQGPFWLDIGGGIRTGDWLDLAKCLAVCEAVFGTTRMRHHGIRRRPNGVPEEDRF